MPYKVLGGAVELAEFNTVLSAFEFALNKGIKGVKGSTIEY
jgi:hypothetical protein